MTFPRDVKEAIWQRDHGRCAKCGLTVSDFWSAYSYHHRRPKGMGGSKDPATNLPSNGVLLCGSGTTGCHGNMESHREAAFEAGFLIPYETGGKPTPPTQVAIDHRLHGLVWLTDDGGWTTTPPEEVVA